MTDKTSHKITRAELNQLKPPRKDWRKLQEEAIRNGHDYNWHALYGAFYEFLEAQVKEDEGKKND